MKKKIITISLALVMAFTFTGCTSKEAKSVIEKIDTLGEVSLETGKTLDEIEKEYNSLTEEDKGKIKNYSKFEELSEKFDNFMYSELKKEIELTTESESHYFAQYYDTKDVNTAKENAQKILETSEKKQYVNAYNELKEQHIRLLNYIEDEEGKIYSNPGDDVTYPFAIDISSFVPPMRAKPLIKQNSNHPVLVSFQEAQTTDELPNAGLFIGGASSVYYYNLTNVDTMEIKVQDENGNLQKALINTQINFFIDGVSREQRTILNQRPAYLFYDKDENMILALQNYEGEDYYVLYPVYK